MSDTPDPIVWPPPPLRPPVDVVEVERVCLVRTQEQLTISDLTKGRTLWTGLVLSFLFVPLFIGVLMLVIAIIDGKAAADGRLYRLFVHEFWPKRLQYAYFTIFFMAFQCFLNFISRNYGLFIFDKQRNMFQKHGKDFYPLSEAAGITTTKIDGIWRVQLVRTGGDRRPRWLKILTHPFRGDHTTIFRSRKQEDIETVTAILTDFTGFPIILSEK